MLYGIHGLLMDSLVSVRLVIASGDAITVSNTENPELFWAIRGAGANFGVVTSSTYQIYDQSNDGVRIAANFKYSPASNRSVIELIHSMDEDFVPELYTSFELGYNRTTNQVIDYLFFSSCICMVWRNGADIKLALYFCDTRLHWLTIGRTAVDRQVLGTRSRRSVRQDHPVAPKG